MKYLLKYKSLSHICDHQYSEFLSSFDKYDKTEEGILLPFVDRNYRCMDMYDEVVNSKIHALSFFSGCGGLDIDLLAYQRTCSLQIHTVGHILHLLYL